MSASPVLTAPAVLEQRRLSALRSAICTHRKLVFVVGDQGVYAAANLVTSIIVARGCSRTEFGLFVLSMRLVDIVVNLLNVLIWAPYTMLLPAQEPSRRAWYLGSVLVHQIVLSIVLASVLRLTGNLHIVLGDGTELSRVIVPVSLSVPLLAFREFSRRMYFAVLDTKGALVQDSTAAILQVGGLLMIAAFAQITLTHALLMLAAASAVSSLIWLCGPMQEGRVSTQQVVADFRENFQLGKWLFASNTALLASAQMSPWLLGLYAGPGATAVLAACEVVVNVGRTVLTSIQNLLGPQLAHVLNLKGQTALKASVSRLTKILFAGSVLFSVVVLLFGQKLITFVYGGRFAGLGVVAFLLSINLILLASGTPASYALTTGRRATLEFIANLLGVVVQLAVSVALVQTQGVLGVCLALTFANCCVGVLRYVFYRRVFPGGAAT